jgi:hypothetical protein
VSVRRNVDREQFYTQRDTAHRLAKWLKHNVKVDQWIEPAAGNGVWLDCLDITAAYDIKPQHPAVKEQDFMELQWQKKGTLGFVGNPPFGRNSKLAFQFFRKCAMLGADIIAFIVPASWGKATVQNRVPQNYHLIYQEDLLDEKFWRPNGEKGRKIPCVFQVWQWQPKRRELFDMSMDCNDFTFQPRPEGANACLWSRGASAGKVLLKDFADKSRGTHDWIHSKIDTQLLKERIEGLDLDHCRKYSTGVPSIAPSEVIRMYRSKYEQND